MPIRPEWRQYYGREWRTVIRPRIMTRAGHCCEDCGKPHGVRVRTLSGGFWYDVDQKGWRAPKVGILEGFRSPAGKWIKVKIGIAHLDHDPTNNSDENLKALCGYCHLRHDKQKHAETRATRKDAARPLLALLRSA
jgi:hypothetical protein